MKKILKNKKAFTLTELIVVIAIIGILAAVLIPSLTGYIEKARKSAAEQEAQTFVAAYNSWLVEREINAVYMGTYVDADKNYKVEYTITTDTSNTILEINKISSGSNNKKIDVFAAYCFIELGLKEALTINVGSTEQTAVAKVYLNVTADKEITGFDYVTKDSKYTVTYDVSTGKFAAAANEK